MKPQFYKTGIINTSDFFEEESFDLTKNKTTMSYTPVKDATNSTLNVMYAEFDTSNILTTDVFRIHAEVSWSGFDTSSTAGTFAMRWQGDTYNPSTSAWEWQGHNTINSALESQYGLKNLVLSATSGSYIYDTTFNLDSTFLSTYTRARIGIRTDYSNGVGKISIDKIYVVLDKYSTTSSIKQRFGKDYIATQEFIEL